jgi:hydrogenase nickel incorporation protein HypA/HybF
MHELALAQGIIDLVESEARAGSFRKVKAVHLEVGALAGVEPEALAFGFDSVARGTIAEGARLELERPKGFGECMACGAASELGARGEPCPKCGSYQLLITRGEELRVAHLEVE